MKLQAGDILVFKGKGLVHGVLSRFLKLFEPWWDGWGWHMAYVHYVGLLDDIIVIAHSTGAGVELTRYTQEELDKFDYRVYRWSNAPLDRVKLVAFTWDYLGCDYDVAVYLWTMLQYLLLHFFNHRIPRLLNDSFTCWEFVFLMRREMGMPIQSLHKYPIITDFLKPAGRQKNG